MLKEADMLKTKIRLLILFAAIFAIQIFAIGQLHAFQNLIDAGGFHSIGVKSDGTVLATCENDADCNVEIGRAHV